MSRALDKLFPAARRKRIEEARASLTPRQVEVHSVTAIPSAGSPDYFRVAFFPTDPPGPYSLQFLEVATGQDAILGKLTPGTAARYYESRDEARTRVLETVDGELVLPR